MIAAVSVIFETILQGIPLRLVKVVLRSGEYYRVRDGECWLSDATLAVVDKV